MVFKYDNYGLMTNLLNEKEGTLKRTALYYILALINKEIVDKEFARQFPTRKKRKDEAFEEYDNYFTAHLQACEDFMIKRGLGGFQYLDVNFYTKVKIFQDTKNQFTDHPLLDFASKDGLMYIQTACELYYFKQTLDEQKSLLNLSHLKLFINTLTFLIYYAKIDKHNIKDEDLLIQYILSKKIGDSWLSRTARKLYFYFRPISNGYRFNSSDNVNAAVEWKYRDVAFDGREATGFKQLWEPVINWLKG